MVGEKQQTMKKHRGGASATTDIEMTQDGTVTDSNTIVNNKGTELPSTGGSGTTIFYVIGASLMLIAAVLLITRKKMQGHNN